MKENEITYDDLLAENKELKKRVFEAEKEINNSKLLNKSEQFLKSIFDHSPTARIILTIILIYSSSTLVILFQLEYH